MGSLIHWIWPSENSVSLKICQQELPKLKCKGRGKKKKNEKDRIPKENGTITKGVSMYVMGILKLEKRETEETLEV